MNIPIYPSDDWGFVFIVVLSGLTIVFAILVLLILVLSVFGRFFASGKNVRKNTDSKRLVVISEEEIIENISKKVGVLGNQPAQIPSVKPNANSENEQNETVAAITAAITAFTNKKIRVVSAAPAQERPPEQRRGFTSWGMAGKLHNTNNKL
jgi:Na+-transporting methylmalonyl-CoA/oxaloacetate decarboxylase gamma subunit